MMPANTIPVFPVLCLQQAGREFPHAWKLADEQRANRGKDAWPDWCFLPSRGWINIIQEHCGTISSWNDFHFAYTHLLAALGAWRPTQDICRFEPTLYEALCTTPLEGDLPCEVLYRLPSWCLYMETPGLQYRSSPLEGFWVHLEYDVFSHTSELWMILAAQSAQLFPVVLDLGPWPIKKALEKSINTAIASGLPHARPDSKEMPEILNSLRSLVNLTLYMCSDTPDLRPGISLQRRPVAKKVKGGLRFFPPDMPNIISVGEKFEKEFASVTDSAEHPHGSPRPHLRRAHWHHFWTGSRKEAQYGNPGQELILRWVSAHYVGKKSSDEETA